MGKLLFAYKGAAKAFYNTNPVQVGVAILICMNFVSNMIEKEIDPDGLEYPDWFGALEYMFNVLFLIELVLNMYGHWFWEFWRDGWNWFDFFVVSIGVIMMLKLPLPKSFNLLRTMRAFRVFRLFRRVPSLKKIIVAIMLSVPGVLNAFLILTIVMCIYAILGVEFFKDVGEGCAELTLDLGTKRNNCIGREYFGTFSRSLFSFFQVMTGDSWAEVIARPVIWSYGAPVVALGTAFYFVSFVLVCSMVLVNVVVAVLLDKMVDPEIDVEGIDDEELDEGLESPDLSELDVSTSSGASPELPPGTRGSACSLAEGFPVEENGIAKSSKRGQASHGNTLHSRMGDIERQLRDMRKAGDFLHADLRLILEQMHEILRVVKPDAAGAKPTVPDVDTLQSCSRSNGRDDEDITSPNQSDLPPSPEKRTQYHI